MKKEVAEQLPEKELTEVEKARLVLQKAEEENITKFQQEYEALCEKYGYVHTIEQPKIVLTYYQKPT